jgi:hypothetical protein
MNMTEIFGFIGLIITLMVVVPASLTALIRVFSHPVQEIVSLWMTLIDEVIDIYQTIRSSYK